MCRKAAGTSSKPNTRSITGLSRWRDGGVHRLEHLRRADIDALDVGALGEDQSRIELGRAAAQAADERNFAAEADGAERAGEGLRPADLDNVIDAAAAGEFDRRLVPFRRALVVDAAGGAERLGARELLVAGRGDDCASRP